MNREPVAGRIARVLEIIGQPGDPAFPFSPSDLRAGEAYEFTIHHLVAVDDPGALFRVEMLEG